MVDIPKRSKRRGATLIALIHKERDYIGPVAIGPCVGLYKHGDGSTSEVEARKDWYTTGEARKLAAEHGVELRKETLI